MFASVSAALLLTSASASATVTVNCNRIIELGSRNVEPVTRRDEVICKDLIAFATTCVLCYCIVHLLLMLLVLSVCSLTTGMYTPHNYPLFALRLSQYYLCDSIVFHSFVKVEETIQ